MARKVDPVAEALGTVALFSGLSAKDLKLLAGLSRPQTFAEGEKVVTEGELSQRFYLITSGSADVLQRGNHMGSLGPGDYFGEISVLDKGPRTATVVATSPLTALSLAAFSFRPSLKQHPDLLLKITETLCERLRAAESRAITH